MNRATLTHGTILYSPKYLTVSPNLKTQRERGGRQWGRKQIWGNSQNFSKFGGKYEVTHLRVSMNPKQDE